MASARETSSSARRMSACGSLLWRFDDRKNVPKGHAGQRKDVAVVDMQRPVTEVERSRVFRGTLGESCRRLVLAAEGQVLRIEIARARSRVTRVRIDGDQLYLHGAVRGE